MLNKDKVKFTIMTWFSKNLIYVFVIKICNLTYIGNNSIDSINGNNEI